MPAAVLDGFSPNVWDFPAVVADVLAKYDTADARAVAVEGVSAVNVACANPHVKLGAVFAPAAPAAVPLPPAPAPALPGRRSPRP